jgi:hypothetical protein
MSFTGPDEVLRQDHVRDQVLDSYEKDLEIMLGSCLYCRATIRLGTVNSGSQLSGRCGRSLYA